MFTIINFIHILQTYKLDCYLGGCLAWVTATGIAMTVKITKITMHDDGSNDATESALSPEQSPATHAHAYDW